MSPADRNSTVWQIESSTTWNRKCQKPQKSDHRFLLWWFKGKFLSKRVDTTELKFLPQQIQYLSGLRNLTIRGYAALEALPEWVANLKSLQILNLEFCWKLMYLPPADKPRQLTPLEDRCTKASRPEWNKISHIPIITITCETIKPQRKLQL